MLHLLICDSLDNVKLLLKNAVAAALANLLKRLSKSHNTIFCGQIQLFLTRLFPLDEKSGLNFMSNFNSEKDILYNKTPDPSAFKSQTLSESAEDLEEGEMTEQTSLFEIDASLYVKFWSLQEFFKSPNFCYEKSKWTRFFNSTEKVLDIFNSIKLMNADENEVYSYTNGSKFPKYLTSEKLLDLQLMDPSFRRYVLVQLLLIFQYLTSSTKFKTSDQILSEEQLEWINRKRKQMLQLLAGDSTTGRLNSGFVSVIQSILDRETHWNRWKNDGCPSFTYNVEKSQFSPRKRRVNPLVNRAGQKIYRFGNRELDKLWNVCPDNLEACRDQRRVFNPDLKTYFQDAILELDPEEKVEEEYKSINKDEWSWRALRLLARRCPHFYINWNPPGRPIKDYLTIILREKIQLDDESKLMNNPNSTTKEHFPSKQPRMDGVLNPSSFDLAPPTTKLSERSKMEHVSDGNHSSITRTRSRVSGAGVGASSKSCHHENGTLDFESNGELESHAAIDDEMQDAL